MPRKHLIIPDAQVKHGVPLEHLAWAGEYIVEKQPDVLVCIGDFADMESLSMYDVGKRSFEGRRYTRDVEVSRKAMTMLLAPMNRYNKAQAKKRKKQYLPKMILTLGNHEHRTERAVEADPKLEGVINISDLGYEEFGWEVYPFLEPVTVDGVSYCHYYTSGLMGRPVTTASALLAKKHQSCVQGHVQGRQIAYGTRADGKQLTCIFAGGFYQHDEEYLRWQGNAQTWRGIWVLHEVDDGAFDEMPVSLNYLRRKYGG